MKNVTVRKGTFCLRALFVHQSIGLDLRTSESQAITTIEMLVVMIAGSSLLH